MTSEIIIGEKVVAATVGSTNPKHIRYVVQAVRPMGSRKIAKIVLEARVESKTAQGIMKECAAKWAQDYCYLWA